MAVSVYGLFRILGAPFRYRVVGLENIQGQGPGLYIANHLGALGPIETVLSVPLRFYPWVIADMTDPRRAPAYLYEDFVQPVLGLGGRPGAAFSQVLAKITVPLLTGIGCVSVEGYQRASPEAFKHSLDLMAEGKNLLIFPEDENAPLDPAVKMSPFECGFVSLCRMYQQTTGIPLRTHPVVVHAGHRMVAVGKPLYLERQSDRHQELALFCKRVEGTMHALYRSLQGGK